MLHKTWKPLLIKRLFDSEKGKVPEGGRLLYLDSGVNLSSAKEPIAKVFWELYLEESEKFDVVTFQTKKAIQERFYTKARVFREVFGSDPDVYTAGAGRDGPQAECSQV